MRPLYRFRPRCEVNNRGEKDQPERKNVLDFAFFLCASCFLFICPGQHTATLSAKHSNKNLPVHSTLQRFEFEEEFCCWPSILSTLRWLESEALPFHWVSFPSWCLENLLGQPSSMEMQPYGFFRSVVKVRTLLQQTHISSDNPKINTTWPKIKTGFLKKYILWTCQRSIAEQGNQRQILWKSLCCDCLPVDGLRWTSVSRRTDKNCFIGGSKPIFEERFKGKQTPTLQSTVPFTPLFC